MPIHRATIPTFQVLRALQDRAAREWYGFELCQTTGLAPGTLYPILARLEQDSWVTSRWEEPTGTNGDRRARRRYYSLTPDGAAGIQRLLDPHAAGVRRRVLRESPA